MSKDSRSNPTSTAVYFRTVVFLISAVLAATPLPVAAEISCLNSLQCFERARAIMTEGHELAREGKKDEAENKYRAAVADFESATSKQKSDQKLNRSQLVNLYLLQSSLLIDLREARSAIAVSTIPLQGGVEIDSHTRGRFLWIRSQAYVIARDFDPALQDIAQALSINSLSKSYQLQEAKVFAGLEQHDDAVRALDRLVSLDEGDPHSLVMRGVYMESLGDIAAAKRDFRRAYDTGKYGRNYVRAIGKLALIGED